MSYFVYWDKEEGWDITIHQGQGFWSFNRSSNDHNRILGTVPNSNWEDSWEYKLMFEPLSEEFLIDNLDFIIPFWFDINKNIPEDVKERIFNLKKVIDQ